MNGNDAIEGRRSMRYNGVVHRKLALLDSQILKLTESLREVSFGEFEESWILRSMAERAL